MNSFCKFTRNPRSKKAFVEKEWTSLAFEQFIKNPKNKICVKRAFTLPLIPVDGALNFLSILSRDLNHPFNEHKIIDINFH